VKDAPQRNLRVLSPPRPTSERPASGLPHSLEVMLGDPRAFCPRRERSGSISGQGKRRDRKGFPTQVVEATRDLRASSKRRICDGPQSLHLMQRAEHGYRPWLPAIRATGRGRGHAGWRRLPSPPATPPRIVLAHQHYEGKLVTVALAYHQFAARLHEADHRTCRPRDQREVCLRRDVALAHPGPYETPRYSVRPIDEFVTPLRRLFPVTRSVS
jgi:hypothetical protein